MSRGTWETNRGSLVSFRLRDYYPVSSIFPDRSASRQVCNFPTPSWGSLVRSRYTVRTTPTSYDVQSVLAVPFSLAATGGIAVAFSS